MHNEIERKFLVQKMPKLKGVTPVPQERYFIQRGGLVEEGFRKKGQVFEHEVKIKIASHEKTREKTIITKEEFLKLKSRGTKVIYRDSYSISEHPIISIKKYKGEYDGLILAEVEFDSNEEAERFTPLNWMGAEVTDTQLGKDNRLVTLSKKQFLRLLEDIEEQFNFKGLEDSVV